MVEDWGMTSAIAGRFCTKKDKLLDSKATASEAFLECIPPGDFRMHSARSFPANVKSSAKVFAVRLVRCLFWD